MADESKTTQTLLRALLREMEQALTEPKSIELPPAEAGPRRRTRVNVREFLRGQRQKEKEDLWRDGGGDDPPGGLRPRSKSRFKRGLG